ncbi:apolipoprotein N-acyltransferase [Brachyspira intermedia]|nr:apolipoprotein N-acyltransferase [Brachyspira intermedia]
MSKSNSYIIGVIILSIISAILLFLAFPPLNLFPMSFIALVPLNIIIFKADKIRYYVISSSIFVLLFFGTLLMWIVAFMLRELGSLISFLTLFTILFLLIFLFYFPAMLLSGFLSKKNPEFRFIIVPVVFTFMEYMRNIGFLGFPWGIIGYSQWNFPIFIQSADIFGVLGISFFVYFSNSIIAHYLLLYAEKDKIKYKKPYIPALIFISSFVLVIIYGAIKMNVEESRRTFQPKTNIALIQHAFDPNNQWNSIYTGEPFRKGVGGIQGFAEKFLLKSDKFKNEEKPDGSTQNGTIAIKRICSLAKDAALSKPSLIVYPETAAIEGYSFIVNNYKDILDVGVPDYAYPQIYNMYLFYEMIKYTQTYHLVGTVSIKENTNKDAYNQYSYYNSIEFVNDRGNKIDEYSKIKLVPGGESYPFQDNQFLLNTFPFKNIINFMYKQFDSAGANRWERGKKITVFNHPNGYRISGSICYESAFGDFMRKFAYNGAQALAVITEDSWSYSDESLLQHFYMSVFRAIENRRDIVHNGNSGVTGHISSTGKIISTLPFWKPDYMIANVALNDRITIYTRFGEWFVYLCIIAIIVFILSATTKTLFELKEIIKKRFFAKKLETVEEVALPSAKKVDEYIDNDNNHDLPSLDDLDELISKKETKSKITKENIVRENKAGKIAVIEEKKESPYKESDNNKKIVVNKKTNALENVNKNKEDKKLNSDQKIDLFSDNTINNSDKYSIFEEDKYTSAISSALTGIIEENEESLNNKDIKKNSNAIKGD